MTINKDIEINEDDLKTRDLIDELSDRLEYVGILMMPEYQVQLRPHIEEAQKKLQEIYEFMLAPNTVLK